MRWSHATAKSSTPDVVENLPEAVGFGPAPWVSSLVILKPEALVTGTIYFRNTELLRTGQRISRPVHRNESKPRRPDALAGAGAATPGELANL